MQRRRIPAAFFLIRNIGRPYCCCGEGRGGAERGEAAEEGRPGRCGAVHARLMQAGRDGIAAAGRGGAGLGRGGGRGVPSDVGLGVARRVGPDGACRDCKRRAAAAALAESPFFPPQQPSTSRAS